jgi:hypothetical protein
MKLSHCLAAVAAAAVCLAPSPGQEKAQETKVKVEVHLAAEHAPEALKAGSRADLKMVLGSAKTKTGKATYSTSPLADGVEVVSVKREKKPADPDKAVLVELRTTKAHAEKIERAKARLVTVVESDGGKPVSRKRPVPLRLELAKPDNP